MNVVLTLLFYTVRMSTPLLFVIMGGVFVQRAGVFNFALESAINTGAFAAIAAIMLTGKLWVGVITALIACVLVNMFFARSGETLAHIGPLPITTGGLMVAVLYSCRLALVIILGAVFLATTTPTAMTDAFGSLLLPFRKIGWHTQEVALVMSLALRFLPTLSDETKAIIDAQSARGGTIETGSPATRVKALFAIIVPILVAALRHADNLSLALDAHCYEEGIHRTHWRVMRARRRDLMVAAACVAYVVALLAVGRL